MSNSLIIKGGRIIDPVSGRDEVGDLFVSKGKISSTCPAPGQNPETIDASGMVVCPGLLDIHVHFREPGNEDAETMESGAASAAAGGFTTVVTMPNTTPPIDSPEMIRSVISRAQQLGTIDILPAGCITSLRSGSKVADIAGMKAAGMITLTDDGTTVVNNDVMTEAMQIAASEGLTILDHAMDPDLAGDGVLRDCTKVNEAGLPAIPAEAEFRTVERDIRLASETGCPIHIQHISTKESVELIRNAQAKGIKVSAEATPHHLALSVNDLDIENTDYKMNPPLGTEADREAIVGGILDGTIRALATDHAPHTMQSKARGMLDAPFGVIGLETAVGITFTMLVKSGTMQITDWLKAWTTGPAEIIQINAPSITPGNDANITILDITSEWQVDKSAFKSKSQNTPFGHRKLIGRAAYTIYKGIPVHRS